MEYFDTDLQFKAVNLQQRIISGWAARHETTDRVRDIIDPAASAKAVARLKSPSEVGCFIAHNSAALPAGIPLLIEAQPQGLYTETYILKGSDGDNLLAVAKDLLDHGLSLGMSIGYKTHDSKTEYTAHGRVRRLLDYALKEYSWASAQAIAHPEALVSAVKARRRAGAAENKVQVQYRVEQQGERWLVLADTDADGDADDNRLIGTYPSADIANAVATALSSQDYQEEQDDMPPDDDDQTPAQGTSGAKTFPFNATPWPPDVVQALPNESFLFVEPGEDDDAGHRVPASKRHFAYRDAEGKVSRGQLEHALAVLPAATDQSLDASRKAQLGARARRMVACADEGTTYAEPSEWQSGAPLSVYGLGHRLIALSEQLASELKAMALLGDEVKGYQRIRPALREELRAAQKDLGTLLDFAETIDRGEDGKQRMASLKAQLALNAV